MTTLGSWEIKNQGARGHMNVICFENCWSRCKDEDEEEDEKEAVGSCGRNGRLLGNSSERNQVKTGGWKGGKDVSKKSVSEVC